MKSLTLFLILFIIKSSISKIELEHYSINAFIDKLKTDKKFDLILSFKQEVGDDHAIILCQFLTNNQCGNCERVVLQYMPKPKEQATLMGETDDVEIMKKILEKKFPSIKAEKLAKIINNEANKLHKK